MKSLRTAIVAILLVTVAYFFLGNDSSNEAEGSRVVSARYAKDLGYVEQEAVQGTVANQMASAFGYQISKTKKTLPTKKKKPRKKKKPVRTMVAGKKGKKKKTRGTAKKITKKKKKKKVAKKKKKKKLPEAKIDDSTKTADAEIIEEKTAEDSSPVSLPQGFPAPTTNAKNSDELETLEEWLAFIFPSPGSKKSDQLIKAFRSKEVSLAVVIDVSRELLKESSERSNIEGVRILGAARSAESFVELARVGNDGGFPGKVRKLADQYLRDYQRVSNIKFVSKVLSSEELEVSTKIKALSIAQLATRSNGRPDTLILTQDDNQNFTHPSAIELQRLAQTLEFQITREKSSDVRRRMEELLQTTRGILQGQTFAVLDDVTF